MESKHRMILECMACFTDQRNLGMSMKVERSTLDQVKKRFDFNKKKLEEKKKEYDINQRLQELKEEASFSIYNYHYSLDHRLV